MRKDREQKENKHRVGGISLGICFGVLLAMGIKFYSMNCEAQSLKGYDDAIFQYHVVQETENKESNLLEEVANWTEEGLSSIKDKKEEVVEETAEEKETEISSEIETENVAEDEANLEIASEEQKSEVVSEAETETTVELSVSETPESVGNKYIVLGDMSVNVRKEPSPAGAKVGSVKPGAEVNVDEVTNGWCHITGEIEGYIIERALKKVN